MAAGKRRLSARCVAGRLHDALRYLFYGFKFLQLAVFLAWCAIHTGGFPWEMDGPPWSTLAGAGLMALGQVLNVSVFYRLGRVGVFYGTGSAMSRWCAVTFRAHLERDLPPR